MDEILIERLMKENEILWSLLNAFNIESCKTKYGIDLHDFRRQTIKIIIAYLEKKDFQKYLKSKNEALDNMILDMYPEKSIKFVVDKNKNIFLN